MTSTATRRQKREICPGSTTMHWMIKAHVIHRVTDLVGDVWVLRVVGRLLVEPQRFESLIQNLGIARSTLSTRLRLLVDQGCIERSPQFGAESGYALTAQGRDLLALLRQIAQWNRRWGAGDQLMESERVRNSCGHAADLELRCEHCLAHVDPRRMTVLQTHRVPPAPSMLSQRRARAPTPDEEAAPLSAEQLMGDRWRGLILGAAFFRAQRFSDFEQTLGIATNILSTRLGQLTRQGLLARVQDSAGGDRQIYRLTERGLSYYPVIAAATAWGERWLASGHDPGWRVLHVECLAWFSPTFVCAACGQQAA